MPIVGLQLTNLGPFEDVTCTFDEHVNVLVGPNNCGKSTALMALGNIVAYPFELPSKLLRPTPAAFTIRFIGRSRATRELRGTLPIEQGEEDNGGAWENMLQELGYTAFIPALRQSTGFRALGLYKNPPTRRPVDDEERATDPGSAHTGVQNLPDEFRRRRALLPTDAVLLRDEVAIKSLIELDTHAYRWNDPAMHSIIAQVAAIASDVTAGFPMQFLRVAEDQDGLFPQFRTPDGDIPFNVLSQGTQSVMQWLTYLLAGYARYYGYPTNLAEQPGVVLIDEIDAHLHPASQRRVIPALRRHFPRLQIFCSTHSPLMLAGLMASQVQLFTRNAHGKVTVSRNDTDIMGWSADEILRGVLGVANPTDLETDHEIGRLQELQRLEALSPAETDELARLQYTMQQRRLGELPTGAALPSSTRVESPQAAMGRGTPKAKAAKQPQKKRVGSKTATATVVRRSSRG